MLDMTTPTAGATDTEAGWIAAADTFAARLALIRQRMRWNVAEAARECGVNHETWRLWEQGDRMPSRLVTIAMTIATRTGCDYLWLVHGPDRGGSRLTVSYGSAFAPTTRFAETSLIVRIPAETDDDRRAHHTRPVRQTRPVAHKSTRPRTPCPL